MCVQVPRGLLSTSRESIVFSSCFTVKDKDRVRFFHATEMMLSSSFRNHFQQHDYFVDQRPVKQLLTFIFDEQHQLGKSIYFDSDDCFFYLGVSPQRCGHSTQLRFNEPSSHSQSESIQKASGCLSCDRPCALFSLQIHFDTVNSFLSLESKWIILFSLPIYHDRQASFSALVVDSTAFLIFSPDTQTTTSPLSPATKGSDAVSSSSVSNKVSLFQESAPTALVMLSTNVETTSLSVIPAKSHNGPDLFDVFIETIYFLV